MLSIILLVVMEKVAIWQSKIAEMNSNEKKKKLLTNKESVI